MSYLRKCLAIAGKDLTIELRSRERLVSMLMFALLVAVVFSFALDPAVEKWPLAGATIWVTILFAGLLGLGRSFSMEKEQDALSGLLVAPIERGALYLGKLLANLALNVTTVVVILLLYTLFFQVAFLGSAMALAAVLLLGCIGFMALGTLFSALSSSTRLGDNLLPVLLLPLLIPVVIFASSATQRLLVGRPVEEIAGSLRMLAAFDLIFVIVCTMIFGAVVEE